jgi:hypothetical protein
MGTEGPTALLDPLRRSLPALDTDTLSGSAACPLPPRHEAVRSARDFTHRTLQRWEIARDLDEIALVVSELVTNALRHGLPGGAHDSEHARADGEDPEGTGQPVRLQLMRWSARLVCAVRDPGQTAPRATGQPRDPGRLQEAASPVPAAGHPDDLAALAEFADPEVVFGCPGTASESGRGLFLVESFSDCWGWHRLTGARPGKVVWAMFRFTPGT